MSVQDSLQELPPGNRPLDGRSARALRTREAIVDAMISLVEEGELRPTAPRVAERAGVSVRSVFQHFEDLPALHMAVGQRIAERISTMLHTVDLSLPLDQRIDRFVHDRAALLEVCTPFRRAANVHGPFAPEIQQSVRKGTDYMRDEVARAFAPELDQIPDAAALREVFEGLAALLSWSAWDALRTEGNISVDEATAVTARAARALLGSGGAAEASSTS